MLSWLVLHWFLAILIYFAGLGFTAYLSAVVEAEETAAVWSALLWPIALPFQVLGLLVVAIREWFS